jgi:hypothetical protein
MQRLSATYLERSWNCCRLLMMQEVVLAEHTHQFMLCLVQPINWATISPCVYAWTYRKRHQAHDNNKTY